MPARRFPLALLALLVAALGLAAACGGGDAGGSEAAGDGSDDGDGMASDGDAPEPPDDVVVVDGTSAHVQSLDNTFRAENIQVAPGTTVKWTNDGRNEHDVLPIEGEAWGVEVDGFQPGAEYEYTFDEPGLYRYYCSIHGTTTAGMIGSVTVADG